MMDIKGNEQIESNHMINQKKLATRIILMVRKDQAVRLRAYKENWPLTKRLKIKKIDEKHCGAMKRIIADYGWPTIRMVGKKGAHAAWMLVQHADEDSAFQWLCLGMMQKAFKEKQALPSDVAHLTDRVLLNAKKKQKFGTQFCLRDGVREPYPIMDSKNVDKRRIKYNLPRSAVAIRAHNALLKKRN